MKYSFVKYIEHLLKSLRERYVWILTGNDYHLWNLSINNCTKKEIIDAARGSYYYR